MPATSTIVCPTCREQTSLAMHDGNLPDKLLDTTPCKTCIAKIEGYKKQGFLFVVIGRQKKQRKLNEWGRFERMHVVKPEAAKEVADTFDLDLSAGMAFITEADAEYIGLKDTREVPTEWF